MTDEELKQKALSGYDAVKCCENGYLRALVEVNTLVSDFIREVLERADDDSSDLAFAPAPLAIATGVELEGLASQPRLIRVPAGGALAVGAVVLLSGVEAARIAGQTGALEALSAVGGAFARLGTRTKTRGGCRACVERKLWTQANPRQRRSGVVWSRRSE